MSRYESITPERRHISMSINSAQTRHTREVSLSEHLLWLIQGYIQEAPWARHVYWLYTGLIEDRFKISRKRVMKELALRGIETRPVFYLITNMPPYRNGRPQRFSVAEKISRQGLSLPSSPLLKPDGIRRVCDVLRKLAETHRGACL
jgi:dTDP-4-amino-4,6-dideoxygalactose transaminase